MNRSNRTHDFWAMPDAACSISPSISTGDLFCACRARLSPQSMLEMLKCQSWTNDKTTKRLTSNSLDRHHFWGLSLFLSIEIYRNLLEFRIGKNRPSGWFDDKTLRARLVIDSRILNEFSHSRFVAFFCSSVCKRRVSEGRRAKREIQ